jgi:hypothetical protein
MAACAAQKFERPSAFGRDATRTRGHVALAVPFRTGADETDFTSRNRRIRIVRRLLLLSGALFGVLCATAHADVGPPRLNPSAGKPGQIIMGRGPSGMPVLMIPAWLAPTRYSCHGGAVCEPYSVGAPSRPPWIRLGRMSGRVLPVRFGTIRFRVPRVAPGRYKVFVYCEPCYRGRRGSLITDDRIFRVMRAGSAGRRVVYPRDRLSIVLPFGWHVTSAQINGVVDPVTTFTATSFPLRHPRPSGGICSVTLQREWHVRGAYVQVVEERDGASRKRMLRRVPPRPRHFETRQQGAGGLCTPADSGQITFQERGRAFYVYYGIGTRTSPAVRVAVRALLDSLRIGRR